MMHSFDDRIREQFSDYNPEVPPHIWENIVAKKKKRRPFFWIWPLLILGGAGIFLMVSRSGENQIGQTKKINTTEFSKIHSPGASDTKEGRIGESGTPVTTNPPASSIPAPAPEEMTSPNNADMTAAEKANTPSEIKSNAGISVRSSEKKKESRQNDLPVEKSGQTSVSIADNALRSSKAGSAASSKTKKSKKKVQTAEPPAVPVFELNESTSEKYIFTKPDTRGLSLKLLPLRLTTQEIPCPEKNAAGNKRYLELYAGPDFVLRSFKDTGHSEYLLKRKESTSVAFAFSAGARFTKVFNNGMSIRTGINYSHIREKFTLAEGNVIRTVFILDQNGDTIGNYSTSGTLYRKTFNKYNTLDVPLLIGYEMGNGKLHTNVNAGVIVNLYSWQKGLVVDTANKAVSITTGSDPSPYQFKTNIGVGFLGSVSFYYKMSERIHILAEPYFRYNLSTFNKEEITLKQKFHNAGLRFGIRYDLK